jgi:MFS family permease
MIFGSLVCFLCGFFYPWALTVTGFLTLRLLHGFSTGFKPTGTAAYIADIVPLERRGEAMGLLGVTGALGLAFGPAVGSWIAQTFTLNTMFYCSSAVALLSLLVQGTLTETLPKAQRQRFNLGLLKLRWAEILEPRVMSPALVTMLCLFPYGAMLTVVPDQSRLLGLEGSTKGYFYVFLTVASLAVRLVASKSSDIHGRVPVLRVSAGILAVGLALLVWSPTVEWFLAASVVMGMGMGLNSPSLYAWTIDLSHPERRGRAVATMYIALEIGIGVGALLAGWLFANKPSRLPYVHGMSLVSVLLAVVYLFSVKSTGPVTKPSISEPAPEPAPEEVV